MEKLDDNRYERSLHRCWYTGLTNYVQVTPINAQKLVSDDLLTIKVRPIKWFVIFNLMGTQTFTGDEPQ